MLTTFMAEQRAMFEEIRQSLRQQRILINNLNLARQDNSNTTVPSRSSLPDTMSFPLQTVDNIDNLERQLMSDKIFKALVSYTIYNTL